MISFRLIFGLAFLMFYACNNHKMSSNSSIQQNPLKAVIINDTIRYGDTILVSIYVEEKIDSLLIFINNKKIGRFDVSETIKISSSEIRLGRNLISFRSYQGNRFFDYSLNSIVYSDIIPRIINYKLLKSYPHDQQAYTQGLLLDSGYLYESTGMWKQSTLRKVELKSGKVLQIHKLSDEVFAEGLVLLNDKLIQISYKNRQGFVYDKSSFQLLRHFYYPMAEGWGLCSNGKELIMTEGSNKLYFLDTSYYEVQRVLEVYDYNGEVNYINEMEFVDGKIYANIYGRDYIVIIDANTARVMGRIDFTGLLPQDRQTANTDVFNGIAYDPTDGNFLITGKNWPLLFRVKLIQ